MSRLVGQIAIVTGASRGIGFGVAQRLIEEGARVCITGRNADALNDAVEALGGGARAIGVAGKADAQEHQQATVNTVMETFGRIDLLVNNAGINPVYGPLMEIDLNAAAKLFDVNVIAGLRWTKLCHTAWMKDNGGAVVNVGSVAGVRASDGLGLYGASKAALSAVTRQLGYELGPNIRVNAVAPAVVKTDFAKALYEGKEEAVSEVYPLGRLGTPQDIAGAVAFLASADAGWITGQTFIIDGGVTLGGRI
jgi:NAD(P)-dependent dehydrogenase (short-subunit alcohol dehydrogenase family)